MDLSHIFQTFLSFSKWNISLNNCCRHLEMTLQMTIYVVQRQCPFFVTRYTITGVQICLFCTEWTQPFPIISLHICNVCPIHYREMTSWRLHYADLMNYIEHQQSSPGTGLFNLRGALQGAILKVIHLTPLLQHYGIINVTIWLERGLDVFSVLSLWVVTVFMGGW